NCMTGLETIDYSVPITWTRFPSPSENPDFPDRHRIVSHRPGVTGDDLILEYANETEVDLWLLLFDCSEFYEMGGTPWLSVAAPKEGGIKRSSQFQSNSGWYAVYVYNPGLHEPQWLGMINVRNSKLTSLTIGCEDGTF